MTRSMPPTMQEARKQNVATEWWLAVLAIQPAMKKRKQRPARHAAVFHEGAAG